MNDMEIEKRKAMLEGSGRDEHIELAKSILALEEVRALANEKVRSTWPTWQRLQRA